MFMTYQVFARKWRPSKFSDVVGQENIITAIKNSFNLNRIHHAYILSGTRGIGKTTIARLFAKGLNCDQGLTYNVCGKCKNCRDIELGCFSDLIEIDAAYYTKVEDIRNFLDSVQYTPSRGKFKVYLIDEAHMLSKHSFNALLKILEEPPKHIKFILATTEYQKLPETIVSRCLHFYLTPLSISQITAQIVHVCDIEKIKIDDNSSKMLAYASKGSIRDALNLLEQAILFSDNNNIITYDIINNMLGMVHIDQAMLLIENLISGNIDDLMHQIADYSRLEVNWDDLFREILIILQKIAINQFSSTCFKKQIDDNNLIKQIESRICILSNRITPEQIQLYYQIFLLSRRELPYAPSYRIGMEMAILRALAFFPDNINCASDQENSINSSLKNDKNKGVIESQSLKKNIHNFNLDNNCNTDNILNVIDNYPVNLNKKESVCKNDFVDIKSDVSNKSVKVIPNFTAKILNMRSNLIKNQQRFNKSSNINTKSYSHIISKQMSESILDKLYNLDINIKNKNFNNDVIKKNNKKTH